MSTSAALPKAVQRQLAEAEKIERAIAEQQKASEAPPVAPSTEAEVIEQPTPAPAVETPKAAAAETEVKSDDAAYWRKRFETVQGMLNAEATRNRETSQQVDALRRQVEELTKPPAKAPEPLVSAKDEETFGSDLIDLARRAAREEFGRLAGSLVAEIRKELNPVREQVGKVAERQGMTEQERFFQSLTDMVADWETINEDPRWLQWLEQVDPLLGAPRQVALDNAQAALDAKRVAALFNMWKEQFQPQQKSANRELERQVAPPKSAGSAPAPASKKIWTRQEYERAFDPRIAKTMSQEQLAQLRADADTAVAEGRVRW